MTSYRYIRAWGEMMGSNKSFIHQEVQQAERDGAPIGATYKRDGEWKTIEGVTAPATRHWFTSRGLMTPDWKIPYRERA